MFLHYPVYHVNTASWRAFYAGDYQVRFKPLNDFGPGDTFESLFEGQVTVPEEEHQLREAKMELWARRDDNGDRVVLAEPPLPVLNGIQRPHGTVLNFLQRPPSLVHDRALIKYLRCLGMKINQGHPRRLAPCACGNKPPNPISNPNPNPIPRSSTEVVAHPDDVDPALRKVVSWTRRTCRRLHNLWKGTNNG